jgi:acetyl-CoA synthetase
MNDQYSELYSSYQWFVPSHFNIAQACVHRWAENPHEGRRIAVYYENELGQREVWTYARLSETANRLSNGLARMGAGAGDRIAVCMAQRPEAVAACMAILSLGAIVVPLSTRYDTQALVARLRNSEARIAIIDENAGPELLGAQPQCAALSQVIGLGFQHDSIIAWRTLLARQPAEYKALATRSDAPALLLYSDDETDPRGALLAHGALIGSLPGFVASQDWFPQKGDIFWTCAEWAWADALFAALLPTLYFGHAIVATPGHVPARRAFEILERYQITSLLLPPRAIKALRAEGDEPRQHFKLALRSLASTGESLGAVLYDWCVQSLGVAPNEIYGRASMPSVIGASRTKWPTRPGSMGRPYPGHRVGVLDARGRLCPAGQIGEIALNRHDIHGYPDPGLFLGYWRDDRAGEADHGGDWRLSGDLARVDEDGYYWYVGRTAEVFTSSGRHVGLGEIEECLLAHPAVADAVVVPSGPADQPVVLKAYVQRRQAKLDDDLAALAESLKEHVQQRLSSALAPSEIEFTEALPLTAAGKALRRAVPVPAQEHGR